LRDEWQAARLLLAARGVDLSAETLAGAALEAETLLLERSFIRSWMKA
jgi:hypothetical protein